MVAFTLVTSAPLLKIFQLLPLAPRLRSGPAATYMTLQDTASAESPSLPRATHQLTRFIPAVNERLLGPATAHALFAL